MDKTQQKRSFIIRFLYLLILVGLIYVFLQYALPLVMPFFIAFIIAFLLKPLINLITRKTKLSRKLVAIVMLTILYLVVGTLLVLLGAKLVVYFGNLFGELPRFYKNTLEPAFSNIGGWFDDFIGALDPALLSVFETVSQSLSNAVSGIISSVSSGAVGVLGNLATAIPWFFVAFVLTIIASYFFVVDYYKVSGFIVRQLSEKARRMLFVIKDYVVNVLFKFARAYFILLSLTFVEVLIGLLILQVPNAVLIALITAIVDILPVLGTGTIMIPWALYALFTGNYFLGIGLAILYAIITVVRQILEPRVVGKQIGLYPLLTLITMFVGARMFGFWGLFGLPVTLVVIIHLNRSGEISWFKE